MKSRIGVAGVTLAGIVVACHSAPSGVVVTNEAQNEQLDAINATTPPGSGRKMLFATPTASGQQPGKDAPTMGQQMSAEPQPPK
ncbi:hypothetical protein FHS31_002087 [Sphingomonas vulcanisoli]|uniref:Lipoprotein n=1 Tax=Sphingomonas vulcanisoli TaxID=1658060 RepID=A0ABX0TXH4_9SPHN|nr:hypothetical protein [Sphingomonas vulcanisoli]NIJ08470.1 hypothetical protein [Sphingomonas vulcanisoli]